jgi:hypothetical protein
MADEFETIELDILEDDQHRMVELYVRMFLSPPAIETFNIEKQTGGIEKALYTAVINHIMLEALNQQNRPGSE